MPAALPQPICWCAAILVCLIILLHFSCLSWFQYKLLPQCKIEVHIYRQQFVPMSGLQNLTSLVKVIGLIVQKVKIFDLLVLTCKVQNLWDFVTIITVAFLAHGTCSLICLQWCCYMGRNIGEYRSLTSFCVGPRLPHSFFKFPLNCNTNYDGISFKTKCKSCNNSSKEFVLRSSCRVSPLVRNVILLIFNDYTPLLVR